MYSHEVAVSECTLFNKKTTITEEMVFGLLNIADEPLLTGVMKQGIIFKIRSGLAVTSLSTCKTAYKIIGKILTISLAVAASPPSLPPRSRATAVRVKMVPAWPRKLAVETTSPVCGWTLKRSARSRLYTSSLFSPLSLSRACAQRRVANRVQGSNHI